VRIHPLIIVLGWTVVLLLLWEASVQAFSIPRYILPPASEAISDVVKQWPYYLRHFGVTATEAIAGLLFGIVSGFLVGIAMRFGGFAGKLLEPLVIGTQVFPKEALAPVFLVVLGFGLEPKIVVSMLISFFPIAIGTARGLSATPQSFERLFRVLGAKPLETFLRAQLPFASVHIFSALRMAASLCVIGAVVGEFVGASSGLGHVIRSASSEIAMQRVYAALLLLGVLGGTIYGTVILIENLLFKRLKLSLTAV